MEDYTLKDHALTRNGITLLDRILVEHQRMKIDRINDTLFCRTINSLSTQVENVKLLINENPRFDWVVLQNEIDDLFRRDRNLNGVNLKLTWSPGENYARIKGKIGKAS